MGKVSQKIACREKVILHAFLFMFPKHYVLLGKWL